MLKKHILFIGTLLFLWMIAPIVQADSIDGDGVGQTIQINTRLHSFVGNPSWLLIIRDVDHNQNYPYLFDISSGNNFWLALTYGRNYLIIASRLQFAPYREWPFTVKKINNFCGLESHGRIIKGKSMVIQIQGDLSPNPNTFQCHISQFQDNHFAVVTPDVTE